MQPVHNTIEEYTGTSAVKCARFLYNQIYGGNKLNSFYIGGKIPETKVNNFLSNYPQTSKTNQKYICYQDSSISGNGKTGFLITDKYFFERQGFLGNNYYIAIKDIKDVIVNPDTSNSILYLVDQNGKQLHHRFYSDSERQKALQEKEFLKKLISFINDNQ